MFRLEKATHPCLGVENFKCPAKHTHSHPGWGKLKPQNKSCKWWIKLIKSSNELTNWCSTDAQGQKTCQLKPFQVVGNASEMRLNEILRRNHIAVNHWTFCLHCRCFVKPPLEFCAETVFVVFATLHAGERRESQHITTYQHKHTSLTHFETVWHWSQVHLKGMSGGPVVELVRDRNEAAEEVVVE